MIFHASMLVTLIGGCLGITWLRHQIERRWPRLSEARLDLIVGILLLLVVIAAEIDHYNSDKGLAATKTELNDTQKKLSAANKEIDALKKQVRDAENWGPTDGQMKVLTTNLKTAAAISPPPPDEQEPFISCVMGDAQSTRFASKLAEAFRSAGWKIKGRSGYNQALFDPVPEGVIFHARSKTENIPALDMLLTTLDFFGIKPVGYVREQIPPGHFDIVIGLKPKQP